MGPLLQVPCANRGVDVGGAYHPLAALVASEGPGWVVFAVLFHGWVLVAACAVFDGFVYALLVDFASVPAFVHVVSLEEFGWFDELGWLWFVEGAVGWVGED